MGGLIVLTFETLEGQKILTYKFYGISVYFLSKKKYLNKNQTTPYARQIGAGAKGIYIKLKGKDREHCSHRMTWGNEETKAFSFHKLTERQMESQNDDGDIQKTLPNNIYSLSLLLLLLHRLELEFCFPVCFSGIHSPWNLLPPRPEDSDSETWKTKRSLTPTPTSPPSPPTVTTATKMTTPNSNPWLERSKSNHTPLFGCRENFIKRKKKMWMISLLCLFVAFLVFFLGHYASLFGVNRTKGGVQWRVSKKHHF